MSRIPDHMSWYFIFHEGYRLTDVLDSGIEPIVQQPVIIRSNTPMKRNRRERPRKILIS